MAVARFTVVPSGPVDGVRLRRELRAAVGGAGVRLSPADGASAAGTEPGLLVEVYHPAVVDLGAVETAVRDTVEAHVAGHEQRSQWQRYARVPNSDAQWARATLTDETAGAAEKRLARVVAALWLNQDG